MSSHTPSAQSSVATRNKRARSSSDSIISGPRPFLRPLFRPHILIYRYNLISTLISLLFSCLRSASSSAIRFSLKKRFELIVFSALSSALDLSLPLERRIEFTFKFAVLFYAFLGDQKRPRAESDRNATSSEAPVNNRLPPSHSLELVFPSPLTCYESNLMIVIYFIISSIYIVFFLWPSRVRIVDSLVSRRGRISCSSSFCSPFAFLFEISHEIYFWIYIISNNVSI